MRFYRSERVASLVHTELAKIIIREIEFPEGVLATITSVDVDKKLERAKIGISVIPSSAAGAVLRIVTARAGSLQFELARLINIKPMPFLMFNIDHGPENAAQVERALRNE